MLIKEKLKSELSIVAWIHKGTNGITSIDLHNQNIWSNECPDILEISVQTRQDGSVEKFGFFGLTRQGIRILNKCQKPSGQSHAECAKKSLYKSYLEYVKFTEGPLETIHDVYEIVGNDPMEITIDDSQPDDVFMEPEGRASNQSENNDDEFWKICRGCKKPFENSNKFCMHASRSKCKLAYGNEWEKWLKDRKTTSNRKKQQTFKANHPEIKSQNDKKYYQNHRKEIQSRKKHYYKFSKMNEAFSKRYMKFKKETKDGPIFVCDYCKRALFKRGIFI